MNRYAQVVGRLALTGLDAALFSKAFSILSLRTEGVNTSMQTLPAPILVDTDSSSDLSVLGSLSS